jgi:hypothetical protein
MPMPVKHSGGDMIVVAILSAKGWEHTRARGWAGDVLGAARLMRRLKIDEIVSQKRGDMCWHFAADAWSHDGTHRGPNGEYESRKPGFWHAPVRFVPDHVPDFGGKGLRYLDEGEECEDGAVWVDDETRMAVPITLPPLPGPSTLKQVHTESAGDDALSTDSPPAELGRAFRVRLVPRAGQTVVGDLPPLPKPDPWARDARRHKDGSHCIAASPAECGRAHLQRPTRSRDAEAFGAAHDTYAEILADASDAPYLRAEIDRLHAELAKVTAEREEAAIRRGAELAGLRAKLAGTRDRLKYIQSQAQALMGAKVRDREEIHILLEAIANGDI